jgi:hypothetical protein
MMQAFFCIGLTLGPVLFWESRATLAYSSFNLKHVTFEVCRGKRRRVLRIKSKNFMDFKEENKTW